MKNWNNTKVLHAALTILSVSAIIGIAFGYAKYHGIPVILDPYICQFDTATLILSATYLSVSNLWRIIK